MEIDNLQSPPNASYQKFFAKFSEIETLPIKEWKTTHVLAYFCKLYKSKYNLNYKFKYNSPAPSKCFEVFVVKKLASLISSDPVILKEYIDWVFEERMKSAKRRLTSIGFMTDEDLMSYYKTQVYAPNVPEVITRNAMLPKEYIEVLASCNLSVKTYGDLILAIKHKQTMPKEFTTAYDKLIEIGLDETTLAKVS